MNEAAFTEVITREIKGLSANFESYDYTDAVDEAERETGFSLPTTDAFQIKWLKSRTKRALFFSLLSESSEDFQVKKLYLQQKFANLLNLIKLLDEEFQKALEEEPYEFANVEAYKIFGTKIDAGFAYDSVTGADKTYSDDQTVIFTPEYEE
jgi:hypothetical protein